MVSKKRARSPIEPLVAKASSQAGDGPALLKTARRIPALYRRINKAAIRARLIANFHVEGSIVDLILSSILDTPPNVTFEDVVGQEQAVKLLRERVVYPALNPSVSCTAKFWF